MIHQMRLLVVVVALGTFPRQCREFRDLRLRDAEDLFREKTLVAMIHFSVPEESTLSTMILIYRSVSSWQLIFLQNPQVPCPCNFSSLSAYYHLLAPQPLKFRIATAHHHTSSQFKMGLQSTATSPFRCCHGSPLTKNTLLSKNPNNDLHKTVNGEIVL